MSTLLTGAHGVVGTAVTEHGDRRYTLLDRRPPPGTLPDDTPNPHDERETATVDVTDASALEAACERHDAVVHLAGCPDVDASFDRVTRDNIRGTHAVLEAARKTDVERVVFASSNHVVGMYEEEHAPALYEPDYDLTLDHESPVRPDSHYGSSKAACEAWGRQYADRYGIGFYAIRIGSVRPPRWDHPFGDAERGVEAERWTADSEEYATSVARLRCTWQSRRDCAHLVECCLADETVSFDIFYGVSDNPASWFDIAHARERVGYAPRDSAADYDRPP